MIDAVLFIVDAVTDVAVMLWRLAALLAKTILEIWDWVVGKARRVPRDSD